MYSILVNNWNENSYLENLSLEIESTIGEGGGVMRGKIKNILNDRLCHFT